MFRICGFEVLGGAHSFRIFRVVCVGPRAPGGGCVWFQGEVYVLSGFAGLGHLLIGSGFLGFWVWWVESERCWALVVGYC